MGAMAEEYGFTYYWAPSAGCAIPVIDGKEAWIMEIFGPGRDWAPGCGKPGAVWCAQRVPDGEATCNANRSRIGKVDLGEPDEFMASPNIHSLAEELGLWKRGTPFIWREAYGVVGQRGNSLREWAALNLLAPSLRLEATGDPKKDQYPFSVRPDRKVSVQALAAVMRDGYQGTKFDVTERPAFRTGGKKSPLARPFGPRDLFDLAGVEPERCIGSETSDYVYISQIRDWLPAPVSGCMWFTLGPAFTSCFAPIYCGATRITDSWSRPPNFAKIDRTQIQWKFQLVEDLVGLKYQEAIKDVRGVFEPAEKRFLAIQPEFEDAAARVFRECGAARAERFVTEYTNSCLDSVDKAYGELADYLTFKHLYSYSNVAPPKLTEVNPPTVPALPSGQTSK
jgi:dipeptidase